MRCLQAVIVRSTVNFEPIQLFACWLFPTALRATAGTRGLPTIPPAPDAKMSFA
jgi:hypothetical protein